MELNAFNVFAIGGMIVIILIAGYAYNDYTKSKDFCEQEGYLLDSYDHGNCVKVVGGEVIVREVIKVNGERYLVKIEGGGK